MPMELVSLVLILSLSGMYVCDPNQCTTGRRTDLRLFSIRQMGLSLFSVRLVVRFDIITSSPVLGSS